MSKITYQKIIRALFVVAWMTLIFMLSAQVADESTKLSDSVMNSMFSFFIPGFKNMSIAQQGEYLITLSVLVRKTAHFLIYTVLGFLIRNYFSVTHYSELIKNTVPMAISFFYATLDELHQATVPGRSCEVRDIFIDSVGAVFGILIFFLAKKISDKLLSLKKEKVENV